MIPKAKIRGFEVCKGFEDRGVQLPTQATIGSAGYDFYCLEDTIIEPMLSFSILTQTPKYNKPTLVATGVKAYMKQDEVLELHVRSSVALKQGLSLANNTGIIDTTYYSNPDNDGHIMFMLQNTTPYPILLKQGERVGQGIFKNYLKADEGNSKEERTGGFGSTN